MLSRMFKSTVSGKSSRRHTDLKQATAALPQLRYHRRQSLPAHASHVPNNQIRSLIVHVRTGVSERRDAGADQQGMRRFQILVGYFERLSVSGRDISDEKISSFKKAVQPLATDLRMEINRDAPFVGIEVQELAAGLWVGLAVGKGA